MSLNQNLKKIKILILTVIIKMIHLLKMIRKKQKKTR